MFWDRGMLNARIRDSPVKYSGKQCCGGIVAGFKYVQLFDDIAASSVILMKDTSVF